MVARVSVERVFLVLWATTPSTSYTSMPATCKVGRSWWLYTGGQILTCKVGRSWWWLYTGGQILTCKVGRSWWLYTGGQILTCKVGRSWWLYTGQILRVIVSPHGYISPKLNQLDSLRVL